MLLLCHDDIFTCKKCCEQYFQEIVQHSVFYKPQNSIKALSSKHVAGCQNTMIFLADYFSLVSFCFSRVGQIEMTKFNALVSFQGLKGTNNREHTKTLSRKCHPTSNKQRVPARCVTLSQLPPSCGPPGPAGPALLPAWDVPLSLSAY